VKFYQVPPPKSNAQRRVGLRYVDENFSKEMYLSWWIYLPSGQGWEIPPPSQYTYTSLGGFQAFFGPASDDPNSPDIWKYFTDIRFELLNSTDDTMRTFWVWHLPPFDQDNSNEYLSIDTGIDVVDYLDQWVQLEVYSKWTTDETGILRAWFNGDLVAEWREMTDPTGYPQWDAENCRFTYDYEVMGRGGPYPFVVIEEYSDMNSIEQWYWVDDIVASTE
jgi:hypothetical protein